MLWQTTSRSGFINATVTNTGLWHIQGDTELDYADGNASSFVNDGIFRKSAGANVVFTNNGRIEALSWPILPPANFANPGTITDTATLQTTLLTDDVHVAPGATSGCM